MKNKGKLYNPERLAKRREITAFHNFFEWIPFLLANFLDGVTQATK